MLRSRVQAMIGKTAGAVFRRKRRGRVVVLCYHSVHPTKDFAVTPVKYAQQMAWLREHCDVVSLQESLRTHSGDRPQVAITFDDGYADNYQYAFPILQEHGLTATFFLTTGLMRQDSAVLQAFQFMRNSDAGAIMPMSWDQVREMRSRGQEFGAHTYSHPNLATLSFEACLDELVESRRTLERELGSVVDKLAYPFGLPGRNFTGETICAAQQAGYRMACAVHYRPVLPGDSPFAVPRFSVLDEEIDVFADKVRGNWDYLGWWQEHAPAWLRNRSGSHQPVPHPAEDGNVMEDRAC
jgi:peptidoglycan/xylan/chitin deacetylase (PgdA/CDA1 family)